MSPVPAIYLAFANDDDNHLALLDEEREGILAALGKLDTDGKIKLVERSRIVPVGAPKPNSGKRQTVPPKGGAVTVCLTASSADG